MKLPSKPELLRISLAGILLLTTTFSLHFIRTTSTGAPDFACSAGTQGRVTVRIASGESGSEIAQSLFKLGVVKSQEAFFRLAVGDSRAQRIAPGTHEIYRGICAKDALVQLLDATRIVGLINIVEGSWNSEILPQLYRANFSPTEVSQAMRTLEIPQGFTSLEGLLFPAQYSFAEGTTAKDALGQMISRGQSEMKIAGIFSSQGKFTPQQLLIIASLIQAEGNTADFRKISQVIRNRLLRGMPLQFDSTVHYIKKSRGSVFLSTQSTLINSAFNTYRRYGLPPGPINNPGADAMRAAVNPLAGNWLYFITVAPFDTRFTDEINQFNTWKVEYKKNRRLGKFRSEK